MKESIRGFLTETVKKTFSAVDMTTYSSILKRYECPSGEVCDQTLGNKKREADETITRYYSMVLSSDGVARYPPAVR